MKTIRKGNDIVVRWTISRNGAPATLNADNISLLISARGQQYRITDFFIEGNTIVFTFLGKDQKCCGAYNLICIENEGVEGMHTTDVTDAFILVDSSSKAGRGCCPEQVQLETVDLESELFAPADGLSAYEIALRHGFVGTEEEWLASLKDTQVFTAIYNETLFAEVLEAYKAGKKIQALSGGIYYLLTNFSEASGIARFADAYGRYTHTIELYDDDTWDEASKGPFAIADDIPQVVDNLTSTDEKSALSANQGKVLDDKITAERNRIDDVEDLVPAQASSANQLADKAFVNSSVQTATANFRGNWRSWAALPTNASQYPADYAGGHKPTVNDYAVIQEAMTLLHKWTPGFYDVGEARWHDNAVYRCVSIWEDGEPSDVPPSEDNPHWGLLWNDSDVRGEWYDPEEIVVGEEEYNPGDIVTHNGRIYKCLTATTHDEPGVDGSWDELQIQHIYNGTWRLKYTGNWDIDGKGGWTPEYQVNEAPLTAAQVAALNSNITAELTASIPNKLSKPSLDGSAGQVLTSDGQGGQTWANVPQGVLFADSSTPIAQIREAIADGKLVMYWKDGYLYYYVRDNGSAFYFMSLWTNPMLRWLLLSKDTGSVSSGQFILENTGNRKTDLDNPDNTHYPTTKAVADGIAAADKVFVAEYGVTTFAAVKAAYDAGKVCICPRSQWGHNFIAVAERLNSNQIDFFAGLGLANDSAYLLIKVQSNNQWSASQVNLEKQTNKVTSLSSESTDTQYPSAKAVYDAIVLKESVGENSVAPKGGNNVASGDNSVALGSSASAPGSSSMSFGNYTQASGSQSFAANNNTKASHARSSAFGQQTKTSASDQFVCGKYNADNSDALFIVGNGTGSSNKQNAFTVTKDGNGAFGGNVYAAGGVFDSASRGLSSNDFTNALLNKLEGLSNVKFRNKRLNLGESFSIGPNMICLCQGDGEINVYKKDTGQLEVYLFSDLAFVFCTGVGEDSDIGQDTKYRASVNYKTGALTYDTKRCALSINGNDFITAKSNGLYIFYVELMS